jgi:hypothetical protein
VTAILIVSLSALVGSHRAPLFDREDPDGDGIVSAIEGEVDTDGDEFADMIDPDSDNDGLLDGVEDVNGDGLRQPWETDRLAFDTDGDGLGDGEEDVDRDGEVSGEETSPLRADTDGDLVHDASDLCPRAAEDLDRYQDDDGCAESAAVECAFTGDVDGDGLVDRDDPHPCDARLSVTGAGCSAGGREGNGWALLVLAPLAFLLRRRKDRR